MFDSPRADDSTPRLRIRLLGAPEWQWDGGAPESLSRKDAALLAKLALDGPQPRAALCELFWPDSSAVQAANSLRQRASRLKVSAGTSILEVGAAVGLDAALQVDIRQIEGIPDEVLLRSPGLLAGVDLGDQDALDRWLTEARLQVAERCAQVLADRAEALEQQGSLHEALKLARRVVEWVPLAEQGWRRLMRLHYLRGDAAAAQDTYWRLHALMRDELGARPGAETQQMFQTVAAAQDAAPASHRPVPVSLLRPPLLVGRHAAWAAMTTAWQSQQPFLVIGEAGLGKSRLIETFVHGQEGVVMARARPGDRQAPDALLGRLLVQIEQGFAPPCTGAHRKELARVRAEFGPPPRSPGSIAVLRHAVETWLVAALSKGLRAVVLDDLHCADPASLDTLRWLAASPALSALRVGLASRPWEEDATGAVLRAWLSDSHRPARVTLAPFTRVELAELLASLALPALLDDRFAESLFAQAGGHPYYTLATLQYAVARGAALRHPEALTPPDSVRALLDERLRDLPAGSRGLLQVAAVGGADLSVERAARMLDCEALSLSDAWAVLEARDVLRGEGFSHDLVHDAALRSVPLGVRQALHRRWAAVLASDAHVPPSRVAAHWEQGGRWGEAGEAWHASAVAARLAGQLAEQGELFERAARCHELAGHREARFEALLARLEGMHLRHGGAAVLAALPEVQALASTSLQRARCRVARIEVLLEQGVAPEAVTEATQGLEEVHAHPAVAIALRAQLSIGQAQGRQAGAALANATAAIQAARAQDDPKLVLRAANALMYVHWSAGRLADAVVAQREELAAAEQLGDHALAAASEGSMAALMAVVGDVQGTYARATAARARHREIGLASDSTQFILNQTVLGTAAAALGRFDEALAALRLAVDLAGADAVADLRAKARLSLAAVWLGLGQAEAALELASELSESSEAGESGESSQDMAQAAPGLRIQAAWLVARAHERQGANLPGPWDRFDRLVRSHTDLSLVHGVVFEASYRQAAPVAIERLVQARAESAACGLHGAASALAWRELVRRLEVPRDGSDDLVARLANALEDRVEHGMSAKCYPPEVWTTLAQAFARGADTARATRATDRARAWVVAAAARMAPEWRHAFLTRHPVNRSLLQAG